jgi:dsRNA-specific ribonuclease
VPAFRIMAREDKKISGKGIHINKKNAREEAALQILRILYEGFPHIYQ